MDFHDEVWQEEGHRSFVIIVFYSLILKRFAPNVKVYSCLRQAASSMAGAHTGDALTDDEKERLILHRDLVAVVPPRRVPLQRGMRRLLVGYTDAEYSCGRQPRVGAVLYRHAPLLPIGISAVLGTRITDEWLDREQQIFVAELFAIPLMICYCRDDLRGADLLLFVDNEAAVSAAIRGVSNAPDARVLVEVLQVLQLRLDLRIWVEWVDSKSNPADGFSREGVHCEFASSRRMLLADLPDAVPPAGKCPWKWADVLLNHRPPRLAE